MNKHKKGRLISSPVNQNRHDHRSTTPKFVTPTALLCIDNSWRSTTLSPRKKLTSSTANLEWCHVHFIRDSYSTLSTKKSDQAKTPWNNFSMQNSTLNPHEIVTRLPLTISIRFVSPLPWRRINWPMFGQGILERIGLLTNGTGVLG